MGSEMCIRDRHGDVPKSLCHDEWELNLGAELDQVGPDAPDDNACLLYTSDAADDLLCVDLGGRRIIKKKINTIYHTKHTHK